MGEFSIMHWLVVGVVVMLVFGAKRLPEMGAAFGKGIREFKKSVSGISEETTEEPREFVQPTRDTKSLATRPADVRGPKRLDQ